MTRAALATTAAALLIAATPAASRADYTDPHPCGHGYKVVYEDDYCWNWATQGNRHRGVTTAAGHTIVVGPCAFRRLYLRGTVATTMRGDWFAIQHGCER